MKYVDFINENLLNNFMDRREMVQIMLQEDLTLEEKSSINKKLKMANFGAILPDNTFSERDHFSVISYYFLAKENNINFEENFILYAHDYLMKYKDFDDVLSYLKLKN